MSHNLTKEDGFSIEIASGRRYGDGICLTDADIASMSGARSLISALDRAFRSTLGPPMLFGGSIHLALLSDGDSLPIPASQLMVDVAETVAALEANASRDSPAPISTVSRSDAIVNVLEAVSEGARKHGTQLCIRHGDETTRIPALAPSVFVRPDRAAKLEDAGTYIVRGITWHDETKRLLMTVGASEAKVALPRGDSRWALQNIWQSIGGHTYLVARLRRESRSAYWELSGDAKLVVQPVLPTIE